MKCATRIDMPASPTILTYGFRVFFLGAALWAAGSMAIWLLTLSASMSPPTAFDPVSWHAHEFLFGYLGAVIAGFLLTSTPNWTRRPPIVGWRLGALAALWLAGRAAVAFSAAMPAWSVGLVDLLFPVALTAVIAREIVKGENWRNLIVLAMLAVFAVGDGVFHWEAARGDFAAGGYGLRLGLGAAVMMIAVIGGRIVPIFTRNWLVKRGIEPAGPPPMSPFDMAALVVLAASLLIWIARPESAAAGSALIASGALHAIRLARWNGRRTLPEPLVAVLHVGYGFVPLGALAIGAEILAPGLLGAAAAQHLWMGGAIGLMTLAVMTRATLGHTGRELAAGPGTTAIYVALAASVLIRVAGGAFFEQTAISHALSGALWIAAFAGFAALYGRDLCRRSPAETP